MYWAGIEATRLEDEFGLFSLNETTEGAWAIFVLKFNLILNS